MDSGGGNKRRKKTDGDDTSKGAKDVDGELTPQAFRAKMGINVDRQDCPNPFQAFAATPFPKLLLNAVQKAGFSSPSAIQSQCWPIALAGKDLIAIAKTGSGKTLGYLFPAFNLLSTYPTECRPGDGPVAVALAPTRELAMQIQSECERFCTVLKLTAVCVYGGVPKGPQLTTCLAGFHILIGTPGRINDFLQETVSLDGRPPKKAKNGKPITAFNREVIPMDRVKLLVLDEADRMLDMGFEPQIKSIVEAARKGGGTFAGGGSKTQMQSLMFTATWPKSVQIMAARYLTLPVMVTIGTSGDALTANDDVFQVITQVHSREEKDRELLAVLNGITPRESAWVIVFANKKHMCDKIVKRLKANMWEAVAIHGDKDQRERSKALERFKSGAVKVIVATDVAARGLDIQGVSHVINYDFPDAKGGGSGGGGSGGVEDWVHRVGRTGRVQRR